MDLHIATPVFYGKIKHIFILKNIIARVKRVAKVIHFMRFAMLISAKSRAT